MKKSGHNAISSSHRMASTILEDANDIATILSKDLDQSIEIPTWWTNKLSICSAYMNSLRDYLVYKTQEEEYIMNDVKVEQNTNSDNEPQDMQTDNTQVKVGNYITSHFDICPSAIALYKNINEKTDMIHLVIESMMLHDIFFKLEKQAMAMGSIDKEMLDKAQHYADMILSLADEMNLLDEHAYIETIHMPVFRNLMASEIVDDYMIPPSARQMQLNNT
jgi:hypothetical protein